MSPPVLYAAKRNSLISIYFFCVQEARCCRIGAFNIYVFCLALQIAVASVTRTCAEKSLYKWCILSKPSWNPQ